MESSAADPTAHLLRHERLGIVATVGLLGVLGWAYLLRGMPMHMMEPPLAALITMWWLMMLAMMLPSAIPAVLLYSRVRLSRPGDAGIARTWVFLFGYLAVWLAFSFAAAITQMLVADSAMALRDSRAKGALLIAAGLYQISPFKSACISQCRSPGQFIARHWRPGWGGAARLGVLHGAYCVGCCWMLMALLFVGGVMNLLWIVGLTALVAAEKLLPAALKLPKISGIALIGSGLWTALN
ncbi:MAG: DUF2182 domain-containing protein [Sphingomicrobium sp.]